MAHQQSGAYEDAVFQCKDHLMTAINAGGYGLIYLTPPQMVDFSRGPAVVQWDMSTERMSGRDWTDVWITPYAENLVLPFDDGVVDLNGQPRHSVHIRMDSFNGGSIFRVFLDGIELPGCWWCRVDEAIAPGTNQASVRQTFRATIGTGHIRFEMLPSTTAAGVVWYDGPAQVAFRSGVVQWGQHSYNPTKDGAGVPATWHWDNFSISPTTPFTIIPSTTRFIDLSGQSMSFASPAPATAYLRFAAVCKVAIDGSAVAPQSANNPENHNEHESNYFVPIAAGTSSVVVTFSPDGWYDGPCFADGFAMWSQAASS